MSQRTTFHAQTPLQALLLEQALLLAKKLEQTADGAPDGQVLSRVEALAVPAARELARRAVQAALQSQAEATEKKGRRRGAAPTATSSPGTRGRRGATSLPPPATSAWSASTSSARAAAPAATPWTTASAWRASSARRPRSC